jgi:diamine N-acetyltransferase
MLDFSIRLVTKNDYAELNTLFEELDEYHRKALPQIFRKPDGSARSWDFLQGVLADQNAVIFIAEIQNLIIGLVYAYVRSIPEIPIKIPSRAGEIDQIIVRQEYRRYGVGKALMERIHQWADQMKLERLELSVWNFNKEAQDFYQELDYEPAFVRMWKNQNIQK